MNMSSIRCLVVVWVALATFLLMAKLPSTHSKFSELNKKCGVYFNLSHHAAGTKNFYLGKLNLYKRCINETRGFNNEHNRTNIEKRNCYTKCFLILDGVYKEDGTLDTKFPERIREEYTKYSNASVSFINNLVKKLSECPKKVAEIFKSLQITHKTACRISGLYEDCHDNVTLYSVKNGTKDELCGSQ